MHPLVYVAGARVVIAALRRSPPWATIEAQISSPLIMYAEKMKRTIARPEGMRMARRAAPPGIPTPR
jgi:hypothetical protein